MNYETAKSISAMLTEAIRLTSESTKVLSATEDEAAVERHVRLVAHAVSILSHDLLMPIYEEYADLMPQRLRDEFDEARKRGGAK